MSQFVNDEDQNVFVVTQSKYKILCSFVKEIGNSSILFCDPEQDEMELEQNYLGNVKILNSNIIGEELRDKM